MTPSNQQDTLRRVLARLQALRSSIDRPDIPEYNSIDESYVQQYHDVLDSLETLDVNTAEFRIPDSQVQSRVISSGPRGTSYSDKKYIRKTYFLVHLDGILNYFELLTADQPKRIGFSPPD
jgi:hypothetical protein